MVLAVYAAVPALAVHDTGVFELDKNAVQDTPPAEDWQNVCDEANPPSTCLNNSTASAHTFETDVAGQSIFTGAQSGGSSKDPQLISGWRWKSGSVPDKDEILHGYAARYSKAPDTTPPTLCPAGTNPTCELLYFGADRFDASGDSQIGFWFYQNRVSCIPPVGGSDCTSNDSTAHKFTGEHKDGDILALSDFVGGGETPSIKVFEWNFDPTPGTDPASPGTTLSANVTAAATTIPVTSTAAFPSTFPYNVSIDVGTANFEIVTVTAKTATTFTVTRTDDPVPNGCLPTDCSLREAVIAANAGSGGDAIALPAGDYRLTFATGEYFAANGQKGFYPEVVVTFTVTEPGQHHHVPLLLSPYAYSTYRGS